eukprot:gene25770-33235_t
MGNVFGFDYGPLRDDCLKWWRDVVRGEKYESAPGWGYFYAGQWDDPPKVDLEANFLPGMVERTVSRGGTMQDFLANLTLDISFPFY